MSVVASVSKNSVVKKEVMNKDVMEAVKEVAIDLLKSWDPASSDFIILKRFLFCIVSSASIERAPRKN